MYPPRLSLFPSRLATPLLGRILDSQTRLQTEECSETQRMRCSITLWLSCTVTVHACLVTSVVDFPHPPAMLCLDAQTLGDGSNLTGLRLLSKPVSCCAWVDVPADSFQTTSRLLCAFPQTPDGSKRPDHAAAVVLPWERPGGQRGRGWVSHPGRQHSERAGRTQTVRHPVSARHICQALAHMPGL